jgi:hypothetical protein
VYASVIASYGERYPNREAAVSNVFDYIEMRERGGTQRQLHFAITLRDEPFARLCTFVYICS